MKFLNPFLTFGCLCLLSLAQVSCDSASDVFGKLKEAIDREPELLEEVDAEESQLAEEPDSVPPPPPEPVETEPIINKEARVAILGYHDFIEGTSTNDMKLNIDEFRDQMQAIKDADLPVISMAQFLAWKRGEEDLPGEECVMITIDDGWKATHTLALPVLKEFGYPFTAFLYQKYVGVGGRSLTHQEIRELMDGGGTIGCHSVSHQNMGKKGGRSDADYREWLRKEFQDSMEFLEENFGSYGEVTRVFAYPFGIYSDECVEMATQLGYHAAFTVNGKKTKWDTGGMEIGRYVVMGKTGANFGAAVSFGGPGGLATGRKLLNETKNEDGELQGPLVTTSPAQGDTIDTRLPLIEVDVSKLPNVQAESIRMQLNGFGTVPHEFDNASGIIRYQVPQRLRAESNKVVLRFNHSGSSDGEVIAWNFKVDLLGDYLPDGYQLPGETGENDDKTEAIPKSAEPAIKGDTTAAVSG